MNATYAVTQDLSVECDAADIRPIETGKKTQKRALAGAGGTEDHSPI
jgi:hypothetical protein